jgi:hypothetical protein
VAPKITVIKLKRESAFDMQRYKVLIDNEELKNVTAVSASLTANELPFITVNIQIKTADFQWIDEEKPVEPLADGPTGEQVNG